MFTIIRPRSVGFFSLAAAVAMGCGASAQQVPRGTPFDKGVQINVVASKPAKGGYYSDKTQKITLNLKFANTDTHQAYEGFSATISILGESGQDSKVRKVLAQEKVDLSLPPLKTQEHTCKEVTTNFYKEGNYKYGYSYDGWIMVVKDAQGAIVKVKSTSSSLEKLTELAAKLELNGYYNSKLKPVEKTRD